MPSNSSTRTLDVRHVAHDNAMRAAHQPQRLINTLLRTKSVEGRSVLAWLATDGALTAAELEHLGRMYDPAGPGDSTGSTESLPLAHPVAWYGYAYVVALQVGSPQDLSAARGLIRIGMAVTGTDELSTKVAGLWVQLLLTAGLRDMAQAALTDLEVDAETTRTVTADLLHPHYHGPGGRPWLEALAQAMSVSDLAPLKVGDPSNPTFDSLTAETVPAREHQPTDPIVTVITSCWKPDSTLVHAARSIIAQSWQRWEMLIVDDASPDPSGKVAAVLEEAESLDHRIRVIRKSVNGGTYRCRNTALSQSQGAMAVVLDSDDWWHPQAMEVLIQPLLDDPDLIATRGQGIRLDEALRVTRIGYPGRFEAAATLMFRTSPTLELCGFFDTVRKAADTEYARRLETATGTRVHQVPRVVQAMRTSSTSLSAADFSRGWRHEARAAYKQAYGMWHRRIHAGESAFLDPHDSPPFPAPRRWSSKPLGTSTHLDLVLGGDWRRYGGPQISMIEEIHAARAAGMRVGILHVEAIRFMSATDDPLCEPVRRLIDSQVVERVFPDDDIVVDVLMVRYPPVFQFLPVVGTTFTPRHLLIMANQAPAEPDGSDQRYVPVDCHRNAKELFGVEPRWVPQGPTIRTILNETLPPDSLTDWDNPGRIDVDAWQVGTPRPLPEAPVVGRFSRDDLIKFPRDATSLLAGYDLPEPYRVVMMGARSTVTRLWREEGRDPQSLPSRWTVLPHKAEPVHTFVQTLDAVVYLDNPDAHEAFGRSLLESAATGLPVIASPKHEATFGDVLRYAEPHEVHDVLEELRADPEGTVSHVTRALETIRQRYGHESFVREIGDLLANPRDVAAATARGWFMAPSRLAGTPTTAASGQAWSASVEPEGGTQPVRAWDGRGQELTVTTLRIRDDADGEHGGLIAVIGEGAPEPSAALHQLTTVDWWHHHQRLPKTSDAWAALRLADGNLTVRIGRGNTPDVHRSERGFRLVAT